MQEILLKTNFKWGLLRSLKKLTLFFLSYLVPFNGKEHEKQKGVELLQVALQVTKQVQKNSFISYELPDHVWWCNIKQFMGYSKHYIC